MRYLHTMIRVADLDAALDFFLHKMDMVEVRRTESEKGRFTLVFIAAMEDVARAAATFTPLIELTYNWDKEDYSGGRNFGHLAYEVDDIYAYCEKLAKAGVVINRPPRRTHGLHPHARRHFHRIAAKRRVAFAEGALAQRGQCRDMVMALSNDEDARKALAEACRAMNASGVNQGAAGNISLRFGEGMLITPSGVDYDRLAPDMIVAMPLDAEEPGRDAKTGMRASSEWRFHRDIFRARGDVGAIVHAHAPYATVLSMLRRPIPASHYMIAAFGGARIECVDYAPFGTQELSDLAVTGLGPRHGVLLGSHGMIAVGHDLERALWLAGELETIAKLHYLASLAGAPVILPEAETLALCEKFDAYGPGSKKD